MYSDEGKYYKTFRGSITDEVDNAFTRVNNWIKQKQPYQYKIAKMTPPDDVNDVYVILAYRMTKPTNY